MYWEDQDSKKTYAVPDSVVDIVFRMNCRCLPLDHMHALSEAVQDLLPWMRDDETVGIHAIHGAESGNGWYRPDTASGDELIYLSRRTRLEMRVPKERVASAQALTGRTLDIAGYELAVGENSVRPLSAITTQFARYVVGDAADDEETFVRKLADHLRVMQIGVRKILCGKSHTISTPAGDLFARSVMIADLGVEEAVRLQERGVGPGRKLGCGLFIPHKDIAPVRKAPED